MKKRILAIVISLALLSSLLIFVIPAAAGEQGAESPFTVSFDQLGRTSYDADAFDYKWGGPPATLTLPVLEGGLPETRTITQGTYYCFKPWISYHPIEGDFGPLGWRTGTAISTLYCVYDYSVGKVTGSRTLEVDLGGDDRAVFRATGVAEFVFWSFDVDPGDPLYHRRATEMFWNWFDLESGNGEFKKLTISGTITRGIDGVMHWEGDGIYTKDHGYVD